MQTIGEKLKEARERKGESIREVAEETKVRGKFIEAMENNQFDKISLAEVYRRGFLKIYARYLRIDTAGIMAEYAAQYGGNRTKRRVSVSENDTDDKVIFGNIEEETDDADFTNISTDTTSSPDGNYRKYVAYIALGVFILFWIFIAIKLVSCASNNGTDSTVDTPTTSVAQYTFKLSVDGATNVKVVQSLDGKVIFEGLVTTNTRQELVAQGDLTITANDLPRVRVQVKEGEWLGIMGDSIATSFTVRAPR